MSGPSIYDTPPDGDFARYVEALNQEAAERLLRQQGPASVAAPGATSLGSDERQPRRHARQAARMQEAEQQAQQTLALPATAQGWLALAPVRQVLQRALVLGFGYLALVSFLPPLAALGWPVLLYFVVFAIRRLRGLPWAAWARQAARRDPSSSSSSSSSSSRQP